MLKVLFCGDTICRSKDNSDPFEFIHDIFDSHDVVVLNLETTLIENPSKYASPMKSVLFFANPSNLNYLDRHKNKIIFSLSNNHILDYGKEGYLETCKAIENWGGKFVGINEQQTFRFKDIDLVIISYFIDHYNEYTQSSFLLKESSVISEKIQAIPDNPFVIVSAHWGLEHVLIPSCSQQLLAKNWLMGGASIVMGHHSHSPQGLEINNNKAIAYSLGNFNINDINPYYSYQVDKFSYMLSAQLINSNEITNMKSLIPIPYKLNNHWKPVALEGESIEKFDSFFIELTSLLSITNNKQLKNLFIYYIHISRSHLLNNFFLGWLPRFKKHGITQLLPFLKWFLYKITYMSIFTYCLNFLNPSRSISIKIKELIKSF